MDDRNQIRLREIMMEIDSRREGEEDGARCGMGHRVREECTCVREGNHE